MLRMVSQYWNVGILVIISYENNPVTVFFKFLVNGRGQAFHVANMDRNPYVTVLVIQREEAWDENVQ